MEKIGFAYIRPKDKEDTIGVQKHEIEKYCYEHGIIDIEYFIHHGAGGKLANNEEFKQLKAEIKKNPTKNIVFLIQSIERLTRDLREWLEVVEFFKEHNVEYCILSNGQESCESELQQWLFGIDYGKNPDYEDDCDDINASMPFLLDIERLDDKRTILRMSDNKKYYLINDELSEMMACDFSPEDCRISENGRKIIMDKADRRFPVSGITNFMYPFES